MVAIESAGRIDDKGKLIIYYKDWFQKRIKDESGKEVEVIIRARSNNISNQQRRYFFGLIAKLMKDAFNDLGTDCTLEDTVNFIKDRWIFRETFNPITGRIHKETISLSDSFEGLSKQEFNLAKEAIQRFAIENLNIDIPEPDPNWRMYKEPKTIKKEIPKQC